MPTQAERFIEEQARQLRRLSASQARALDDTKRILDDSKQLIRQRLGDPSEWEAYHLTRLERTVDATLREVEAQLSVRGLSSLDDGRDMGFDLVDQPIRKAGIDILTDLARPDLDQLLAMRSFMTDRMKDVSTKMAKRIKSYIGLVMTGAAGREVVVAGIDASIRGGRSRAITIVRTEMGRAFSMASQERMTQAAERLPGLKKQWRRSGKLYSRTSHDIADGQIVGIEEPFTIGGRVKLDYPRDPKGPPGETINCGCISLPFMASWDVRQPDRQPFSAAEQRLNVRKRDLARELDAAEPALDQRVQSIEAMGDLSAARQRVALSIDEAAFTRFASQSDGRNEVWPVGVLPDDLQYHLGTSARAVRLSKDTIVKQLSSRAGQQFSWADYGRLQNMLDNGMVLDGGKDKIDVMSTDADQPYIATLKRVVDNDEVYLVTMRRTRAKEYRRGLQKNRRR